MPESEPASIALPSDGSSAISIAGADDYLGTSASGVWAKSGGNEPRPTASAPVTIEGSIVEPTAWWRLTHPSELGQ